MFVLAIILARTAAADSSAILDDLQARAVTALHSVPRAGSKSEADAQREPLRRKLEASLGFSQMRDAGSVTALLYMPERVDSPAPTILLVRPHEDPKSPESQILVGSLVRLGFIVLSFDLRAYHSRLDLLPSGIPPQGLVQHEIRAGLTYLVSRPDVDAHRIGLIGSGLAATLAAALNPQLSAIVLLDGGPDLEKEISRMRDLRGDILPDTCLLIPGLVRYGATQELFAMIVPRPVLAIRPAQSVFDYVSDLYSSFGEGAKVQQGADFGSEREFRYAVYRWVARWLQSKTDLGAFLEPEKPAASTEVQLADVAPAVSARKRPLTRDSLFSLLGAPLPEGLITWGLNKGITRLTVTTQPGLQVPITVFRPGPDGYGPELGLLVALSDAGKETLGNDEVVQEALRRGWVVWAVDARGLGQFKPIAAGFVFGVSLLLGENFVWRQASDVRRILEWAFPQVPVSGIYARGPNAGIIATYVGALAEGERPVWIALRDAIFSFSDAGALPPYVPAFDALSTFDISDLIATMKPKVIVLKHLDEFLKSDW